MILIRKRRRMWSEHIKEMDAMKLMKVYMNGQFHRKQLFEQLSNRLHEAGFLFLKTIDYFRHFIL